MLTRVRCAGDPDPAIEDVVKEIVNELIDTVIVTPLHNDHVTVPKEEGIIAHCMETYI